MYTHQRKQKWKPQSPRFWSHFRIATSNIARLWISDGDKTRCSCSTSNYTTTGNKWHYGDTPLSIVPSLRSWNQIAYLPLWGEKWYLFSRIGNIPSRRLHWLIVSISSFLFFGTDQWTKAQILNNVFYANAKLCWTKLENKLRTKIL